MGIRRTVILGVLSALILGSPASAQDRGNSVRSRNFVVEAPTPQLAREFAQLAEEYRRSKAIEWLGQEMPDWKQPCPLRIQPTGGGGGGATHFNFDEDGNGGTLIRQRMEIEGSIERMKNSVLPHEVTHTVLASYFRQPVPRWADEGGAVYSEDAIEHRRHDVLCRQALNRGRGFPLRRLFGLRDYPEDRSEVMVLYAQGYSTTRFLVERKDRKTFLAFVGHGMSQKGWDDAARVHYGFRDVAEMEQAWLAHLRAGSAVAANPKPRTDVAPAAPLAARAAAPRDVAAMTTRTSNPPMRPTLEAPVVVRGRAADNDDAGPAPRTTGWTRPVSSLGSPVVERLIPDVTDAPSRTVAGTPASRNRSAPPPVILFPPEVVR